MAIKILKGGLRLYTRGTPQPMDGPVSGLSGSISARQLQALMRPGPQSVTVKAREEDPDPPKPEAPSTRS